MSNPSEFNATRVNDTTLRVTKNGNYSFKYVINIFTLTRFKNITLTAARAPYIEFIPSSVYVSNGTTEFDIRVLTNFFDVNMLTSSVIQWYRASTGEWKTTVFQAAAYVDGFGSPEADDSYNYAHEDRDFTIHVRSVNPSTSSSISFFEQMPVSQYYYVPYTVVNGGITVYNSDQTAVQTEDSVEYHGTTSTRGYYIYSTSAWSATLPQGVQSYGPTTGDAGITAVTFSWGSGEPNTSKTITFTNTGGATFSLVCHYVTE